MTPDEFTNQELMLPVGGGCKLYVQDWGKKDAKTPIIFLHGGPGGGCNDGHKGYFDPSKHRVIFFDQRGAGKSTPHGSLENNTTDDLIEDIEKIARKFKSDKFIITGGSWGSCLALAYGLKYPQRVKAMVLRGIFTGSKNEIDWLDKGHWNTFFPEIWDNYLGQTPKAHQSDPTKYHAENVLKGRGKLSKKSAYAYGNVEGALLNLDDRFTPRNYEEYDPAGTKIEMYYLQNGCFMPDRYIMDNAYKITMPVWLIQGRYDMVCPPITAYELNKQLPNSRLIWTQAGHSGSNRENWLITKTILEQF